MSDIARILFAPLVWLASFSAVYGLHGIACAHGWGGTDIAGLTLLRIALVGAWLGTVAVQTVTVAGLHSERFGSRSRFVRHVSRMTGWAGLVATVWTLFPAVATSSCG